MESLVTELMENLDQFVLDPAPQVSRGGLNTSMANASSAREGYLWGSEETF